MEDGIGIQKGLVSQGSRTLVFEVDNDGHVVSRLVTYLTGLLIGGRVRDGEDTLLHEVKVVDFM